MNDTEFLLAFEDRTLPFGDWHHRAHVKVAYLYLRRLPLEAAVERMRSGIKAYNAANSVPEGLTMGYHDTMTQAFMRIIAMTIREHGPAETADAFCDAQPQLMEKKILRLFYSRERICSAEAKAGFVEPDLAPLPISTRTSSS